MLLRSQLHLFSFPAKVDMNSFQTLSSNHKLGRGNFVYTHEKGRAILHTMDDDLTGWRFRYSDFVEPLGVSSMIEVEKVISVLFAPKLPISNRVP